jgi:carbon storage regulator CsrA
MALLETEGLAYCRGGVAMKGEVKDLGRGLVLGRKPGQQISIGDNVVVTVIAARGDYVRLHLSAPRDVSILRTELVDETQNGGVQ